MFLNDQETATDLLYFEAISKTVVKLISASGTDAVTIGIHGDWGAGKSSILKMVESCFREDDTLCLWFNGWAFEGFDDAKTIVIETVVDELVRARPKLEKVKQAGIRLRKRIDWFKIARKTGGVALTALSGAPPPDLVSDAIALVKKLAEDPARAMSVDNLTSWATKADEFIKHAPEDAIGLPAHMHAFREEFVELLDAANVKRLVVLVDDLDRCLPETAIATLEAIRLFLFVERTAFIIGADEAMIEYAVRDHFPDLPPTTGPVSYTRNYLEKLIQVPFRIPALGAMETRIYVALLLAENTLETTDPDFQKLLGVAREQLKRPWLSQGLERSAIEAAIRTIPPEIEQALSVSSHVSAILSEGAHGNPRQIKRFLNTMMLREAIAEERGFREDIKRPALAKIMLAERFAPTFYGQLAKLAAADVNGRPQALAALEEHSKVLSGGKPGTGDKDHEEAADKLPDLAEWLQSEWILRWAKSEPKLSAEDLRPYVFVTRDKRGALAGVSAHQHLEAVIEKLMSRQIVIANSHDDVRKLTGVEPEAVFDAIRDQILAAEKLSTKPDGVDGLSALVEIHPHLQMRLVEFLESLPVERIGTWVTSSWGKAIKEEGPIKRFTSLRSSWASQSENRQLQTASRLSGKIPMAKGN